MKIKTTSTLFSIFAVTIFLTGILASVTILINYPKVKRQQKKDIDSIKLVEGLEQKFNQINKTTIPFKKLYYDNLPDPKALIKNIFGGDNANCVKSKKTDCGQEYALNHIEINLNDISLDNLPGFIRAMESLRPPIQLNSITVNASKTTPGRGSVDLTMTRVELQTTLN